MFHTCTAAWF